MLYTRGLLSSAAGVVEQSASGKAIGVDELQKVMNSSASDKQKTSFFIQYLLSQRECAALTSDSGNCFYYWKKTCQTGSQGYKKDYGA